MSNINLCNNNCDAQNTQSQVKYIETTPDCDIEEVKDAYIVKADMPGLNVDKIKVELDRDLLTVDAVSEVEGLEPRNYVRQFRVMRGLDASKIQADYKFGVLTINLPKPVAQQSRKIAIQCD